MGEDEFFGNRIVGVVLHEEFFKESIMFSKYKFLFICQGSFVDIEQYEINGVIFYCVIDDVFVVGAVTLHVLSFLEMLYRSDLITYL